MRTGMKDRAACFRQSSGTTSATCWKTSSRSWWPGAGHKKNASSWGSDFMAFSAVRTLATWARLSLHWPGALRLGFWAHTRHGGDQVGIIRSDRVNTVAHSFSQAAWLASSECFSLTWIRNALCRLSLVSTCVLCASVTDFSTQMISWHSEHLPKQWLARSISSLGPSQPTSINSGFFMPQVSHSQKPITMPLDFKLHHYQKSPR